MQAPDPERAFDGRSWEWLLDLPERLHVVVELIDRQQTPVFAARSTPAAASVRRMIVARGPAIASAVADVLQSAPTARVVAGGFQVLCLGLSSLGVLLLARETIGEPSDEGWHDLELVGSWIINAIETSFTRPHAPSIEPYRI